MHKHFSCPYYQHPQKNKEPSVTSNVPKALNFYGFTPILFFLFVSIKRVLFRGGSQRLPVCPRCCR